MHLDFVQCLGIKMSSRIRLRIRLAVLLVLPIILVLGISAPLVSIVSEVGADGQPLLANAAYRKVPNHRCSRCIDPI